MAPPEPPTRETAYATLVHQRGFIKGRVTAFTNFLGRIQGPQEGVVPRTRVLEVRSRLEKLQINFDEFLDYQFRIETEFADLAIGDQEQEREIFEDAFHKAVADAQQIIEDNTSVQSNSNNSTQGASRTSSPPVLRQGSSVSLPKITLPTFCGDYDSWIDFKSTFTSLIHADESMDGVRKFHYLRGTLAGDAAQIIKPFALTEQAYVDAWDTLCNRYDNNKLLLRNHIKALFCLEPIHKESSARIRATIDSFAHHLSALEHLQQPTAQWDTLLIYLIVSKLDVNTTREWEGKSDNITYKKLIEYLRERANVLETIESMRADRPSATNSNSSRPRSNYTRSPPSATHCLATGVTKCPCCTENHYIYSCPSFLALEISDRIARAQELRLCLNCLRYGHSRFKCRSGNCKVCNFNHNTALHLEKASVTPNAITRPDKVPMAATTSLPSNSNIISFSQSLVSTALINIFDAQGKRHTARALLDNASQSNFITVDLANRLNLNQHAFALKLNGIANTTSSAVQARTSTRISSRIHEYAIDMDFLVLPSITGITPSFTINRATLHIPNKIQLADPFFHAPGEVDLLIGTDAFLLLLTDGKIVLGRNRPVLQNTWLGWIIGGRCRSQTYRHETSCHTIQLDLHDQLQKFWQLEECSTETAFRGTEQGQCEEHFKNHVKRDDTGRFEVMIPIKGDLNTLGASRENALRRFFSTEKRLATKPSLYTQYKAFMREYETLGHMTPVKDNSTTQSHIYYLPHHAVVNANSETTRLRVVFDGSAATSTGKSINDYHMIGPVIQEELFSILLRFRSHRVAVTSDIAKMYRQVRVSPLHRDLQRILWRYEPSAPIQDYQLNTITYGTASASFLAIRCLHELANNHRSSILSMRIKRDFYVDDFISGANTREETIELCKGVSSTLEAGGFPLRKWNSSDKNVLEAIKSEKDEIHDFGAKQLSKTLGLLWASTFDHFTFRIQGHTTSTNVTKRQILSETAQVFDPLGLVSPCTIIAKMLLQTLWQEKVDWDDPLNEGISRKWHNYRHSLIKLNTLSIPRCCLHSETNSQIEMHGFCDASERAYGACIYIRSTYKHEILCRLLCSKTKVAPIKPVTIPRLELSAALLLSRLFNVVARALEFKIKSTIMWTDSTVALGWLRQSPDQMKTFVSNRVNEIQELTQGATWRHVATQENPADLLSRGMNPERVIHSDLWWSGPAWLSHPVDAWPIQRFEQVVLPEMRNVTASTCLLINEDALNINIESYSDLSHITRILAYAFKFIHNARSPKAERSSWLSTNEINKATMVLVRLTQHKYFDSEFSSLKANKHINRRSTILGLTPFIEDDIIRVGGRLKNAQISYNQKHPILLPSQAHFTKLLFEREHKRLLHAGPLALITAIRDHYWVISARNLARKTVHKCITCFKSRPKCTIPIMGNLPKYRVTPTHPFHQCGMDYAGPILIKASAIRNAKSYKAYICIFICMAVKAVHLEVVTSLTTDSFIAALRRFVSRRGKPAEFYSDNGTNFVGANNQLRELYAFIDASDKEIGSFAASEGIVWHFLPPRAPNFGGLWEAAVKSMKFHLKRVIGESRLTYEDFTTVLVQVEAIMNSRPLSALSTDPNDLCPLTPAHFLVGRKFTSIADYDYAGIPDSRLSKFQKQQATVQGFWKRWSQEYLNAQISRSKWRTNNPQNQPKVGQLALIKPEADVYKWQLGRILQLHHGEDNVARVATLRTGTGEIKRPVSKIAPLPIDGNDDETDFARSDAS